MRILLLMGLIFLTTPACCLAVEPLWIMDFPDAGLHPGMVGRIALSPDNRFLVSSNPDKTELFVVSTNGTLMWSYVPEKSTGGWSPWISEIAISPDSSRIGISVMVPGCCRGVLTNTTSNKVILFDRQGNLLWNYSTNEPPGTIAFSANGVDIFVGYHTRSLICLDRSGALRWKYQADSPITDIAVSPDGNFLLATGENVEGQYTNDAYYLAKDGRLIWKRQVRGINTPGISPEGQDLIVSGYPGQNTFSFGADGRARWEHSLYSDIGRVLTLATNGRYVLAGSEDKIQLLDHHGERLWNYSVSSPVYSVSLSENGETIAAGTATGIIVFDGSGNVLNEYRLNQTVCPVIVSRDGTSIAALSDRLLFFQVREGVADRTLPENNVSARNNTAELSETTLWYHALLSLFSMAPTLKPKAIQVPSQAVENVSLLTVIPLQEYAPGEQVLLKGITSLPSGEVLDIAWIREPFHTTKCNPGTFCGSGTSSTIVSVGTGSNVWSYSLNTTGFSEGGYDIWIVSRSQPNTFVHAALSLNRSGVYSGTSPLAIALGNDTVQSLLSDGYSVQSIEPSTVGINKMPFNVTCVMFETPHNFVGVNVDVKNTSIVNIWTLPKREPMPGSYPEPMLSGVSSSSLNESLPDFIVNYSEIAYIGIQDPSDPVDENRKNTVAQAAIADDRARTLLVDGGRIEGVLFQCHPTPKDSGGAACALALRVLYEGSNWDFLVDEKSREVIFVQREVLPGRI